LRSAIGWARRSVAGMPSAGRRGRLEGVVIRLARAGGASACGPHRRGRQAAPEGLAQRRSVGDTCS
jgi:hypothetical protein